MTDPLFDLTGRRAFVTGAAGGIGQAVAKTFREAGAAVVLADLNDPAAAAESIGAQAVTVDVSDEERCQKPPSRPLPSFSMAPWMSLSSTPVSAMSALPSKKLA